MIDMMCSIRYDRYDVFDNDVIDKIYPRVMYSIRCTRIYVSACDVIDNDVSAYVVSVFVNVYPYVLYPHMT